MRGGRRWTARPLRALLQQRKSRHATAMKQGARQRHAPLQTEPRCEASTAAVPVLLFALPAVGLALSALPSSRHPRLRAVLRAARCGACCGCGAGATRACGACCGGCWRYARLRRLPRQVLAHARLRCWLRLRCWRDARLRRLLRLRCWRDARLWRRCRCSVALHVAASWARRCPRYRAVARSPQMAHSVRVLEAPRRATVQLPVAGRPVA